MDINITPITAVVGLVLSILTLWGIVVRPFKETLSKNAEVMGALDKTVSRLQGDLEESKKDRAALHGLYERLDNKVEQNSQDIIRHEERIATLFKRSER